MGSGPVDIVVRTIVIYGAVVVGLRLGGKREVGQLGTVDLVALLLLSNAVQNAMVGTDTSLGGGLLAGAVILGAARGVDMLADRSPMFRKLLIGESRVLIENGHVNRRAMERERISDDELQEALHEHGLEFRREVKRATIEVDGSISILPQPEAASRYQAGGGPDSASRRAGRMPRHSTRHMGGVDGLEDGPGVDQSQDVQASPDESPETTDAGVPATTEKEEAR